MTFLCILVKVHVFWWHFFVVKELVDTCLPCVCTVEYLVQQGVVFFLHLLYHGHLFVLHVILALVVSYQHDARQGQCCGDGHNAEQATQLHLGHLADKHHDEDDQTEQGGC